MKTKRVLFISCLAAGAVIASPSFGKPAKKSAGISQSNLTRVAPHTTQVTRHNQNTSPRMGGTRYNGTALTRPGNSAGRVTTAQRAITATITVTTMGAAPAITTADPLTRTTATTQAGRTRTGVMAHRGDIIPCICAAAS
jgi:hypothetical protein